MSTAAWQCESPGPKTGAEQPPPQEGRAAARKQGHSPEGQGPARRLARPFKEWFGNLLSEPQRSVARMLSVPGAVEVALETRVGITPSDVVLEMGAVRLLRYRRTTPARYAEPVLFCYALINRPYILDLQEGRSVVQRYLEQGFDVYMLDWGVPSASDSQLKLEDYVGRLLKQAVDFVLRAHARKGLHLLGYCMGGTISTLFTAEYPEKVDSLTLLAAPIDFSSGEGLLNLWTDPEYFDVDAFVDAHGNCPGWFLQSVFLLLKPVQNLIEKNIAFYERLPDRDFLANFFAMDRWLNDNIPVAGETFRQFVKNFYQENELVRGTFQFDGHTLDLGRITCPLLLLSARDDHLVPPASTNGIEPHVGSRDIHQQTIAAGHVGLVVSSKAQKILWPAATQWLADRSTTINRTTENTVDPSF